MHDTTHSSAEADSPADLPEDPLEPLPLRRPARWPDPTMNFIIAYDICEPKRLKRVAQQLERDARRVQKSVFMFTGTRRQLEGVIRGVMQIIDPSCDRVQAWPIRTSTRSCRADAGDTMPDTGLALVFTDQEWTMIEARDDDLADPPWLLE
ncbi:MAG: hypothetical protein KatS3mg105_5141 [Gemmatales bacterium]|nr:MAG: hypothetical protein KatS3mg105_5141 [Gemmatales bacterium]GIW97848.1 MAG: hypothetical protein KatS3mg111_1181 [Pirellulaceae bacterium]